MKEIVERPCSDCNGKHFRAVGDEAYCLKCNKIVRKEKPGKP